MIDQPWLTTREVAARLHVSIATIHNWIHSGKLVPSKFGSHRASHLFSPDVLASFEAPTKGRPKRPRCPTCGR